MRTKWLAVAGIVALGGAVVGAGKAGAQEAPSPFHAGQWGIEAYAAGQNGGIMRFFTPRTALVLSLSADRESTTRDEAGLGPISSKGTLVDVTLGLRRHSMLAQHIAGTFGAGLMAGSIEQKIEYSAPQGTSSYHGSHLGAYVDVGGQYMVADHLAIGLAYRFSGQHVKAGTTSQTGSEFAMSFLPVRATLYF